MFKNVFSFTVNQMVNLSTVRNLVAFSLVTFSEKIKLQSKIA